MNREVLIAKANELINGHFVTKADLSIGDIETAGGEIKQDNLQKFMAKIVEKTVLAKMIRTIPLKAITQSIPVMGFTGSVSVEDEEYTGSTSSNRRSPSLSKVTFNVKRLRATTFLSYEDIEENIEKDGFITTVTNQLIEAIARDIDNLILNGDTATDPGHPDYLLLKTMDGLRKIITTNTGTIADFDLEEHANILKLLDPKYLKPQDLLYIQSARTKLTNMTEMQGRETQLGDATLLKGVDGMIINGIPVIQSDYMPITLGGGTETDVVLLNKMNCFLGILKNITVETDKDIDTGTFKIVARYKLDLQLNEEPANVLIDGVTI